MSRYSKLKEHCRELVDDVIDRYGLLSWNELQCPHLRGIARELESLEKAPEYRLFLDDENQSWVKYDYSTGMMSMNSYLGDLKVGDSGSAAKSYWKRKGII